jgi:hypothetical protein
MVFSLVTSGSGTTKTLAHAAILDPLGGKDAGRKCGGREAGFSQAQPISRWNVIEGLDFWSFGAYY